MSHFETDDENPSDFLCVVDIVRIVITAEGWRDAAALAVPFPVEAQRALGAWANKYLKIVERRDG